jgi:hypothetical protein
VIVPFANRGFRGTGPRLTVYGFGRYVNVIGPLRARQRRTGASHFLGVSGRVGAHGWSVGLLRAR